ncbi:MAG: nucleotidyl transferase AbiEii/AbiGii toxin family protein [Bacteroidales bacterium]
MHTEIINPQQSDLIPYLKDFKRSFYLVGGTAIALHIGHRQSIDFDMFTPSRLDKSRIKAKLKEIPFEKKPIFEDYDQLHLLINDVKVTFFNYPYSIEHPVKVSSFITMPTLLTLAAMKAFALGRRAKWKDYVDMFFILRDHYSIKEIANQTQNIFGQLFSEKLFRSQLAFHKDIDYTEPVTFIVKPVSDDEIKNYLIEKAIDLFD